MSIKIENKKIIISGGFVWNSQSKTIAIDEIKEVFLRSNRVPVTHNRNKTIAQIIVNLNSDKLIIIYSSNSLLEAHLHFYQLIQKTKLPYKDSSSDMNLNNLKRDLKEGKSASEVYINHVNIRKKMGILLCFVFICFSFFGCYLIYMNPVNEIIIQNESSKLYLFRHINYASGNVFYGFFLLFFHL